MTDGRMTEDGDMTGKDEQRRSGTIQSVSIAARFLKILADAEGPMALGELARRAGTGNSTAHRYMQSLVKEALAAQDPASGQYDLGPAALDVGIGALRRIDPVEVAARHMKALAMRIAASGGVAIWTDRGPTIVRWYRSAYFSISAIGLGDVLPIDNTACGLVFQAFLPPQYIEVARRLQPAAFRGKAPPARDLARIRQSFGCERSGHLLSGIAGQAAPVFDAQHEIACVLTTTAGSDLGGDDRQAIFAAAREVTAESGGGGAYGMIRP
jgi:DNA-binding IclR family transcriptional regulator